MATPRRFGSSGSVIAATVNVNPRLARPCPTCGAVPYSRCYKLSSWVVVRVPLSGMFTARQDGIHPERRAERPVPAVGEPTRPALRREIQSLMNHKVGGHERVALRRWIGSVQRTVEDLTAKRDELAAMPDL
jgi:hypothetical protein